MDIERSYMLVFFSIVLLYNIGMQFLDLGTTFYGVSYLECAKEQNPLIYEFKGLDFIAKLIELKVIAVISIVIAAILGFYYFYIGDRLAFLIFVMFMILIAYTYSAVVFGNFYQLKTCMEVLKGV